ncbi:hypothetical protein SAMN05216436_11951 [bacterium A37T11]|nr:hypothetical protein SAMN05216436_11951 [bacterium A37T11]
MISDPSYLAAKMVSTPIRLHFEQQYALAKLADAREEMCVPDLRVIEAIIDTAFWASLRHEEGYTPKISVAFLPPAEGMGNILLHQPQRLTPHNLVKLSPAVIDAGIHLGVWQDNDSLFIWGTTHHVPPYCLVLEVIEAGLLVVKQRRDDAGGKFINIAVLKGDQVKMVDETKWGLSFPIPGLAGDTVNILVELAVAMRRHGRGALLLIVPANSQRWLRSIVQPISYQIHPAYNLLPEPSLSKSEAEYQDGYETTLHRAINAIGGFSAIDGATVLSRDHQLLAFGAKVARSDQGLPVGQILLSEPVRDAEPELVEITKIGGTRHLAAAQFVHDQRDSLAMVASQDGLFTVFVWSEELQLVHAHRIDTILI